MRGFWGGSLGIAVGPGAALARAQDAPKPLPPSTPDADGIRFFETKIRPLLAEPCFACHGEKSDRGGLRLNTAAAFRKGRISGDLAGVQEAHVIREVLA